MYKYIFLIGIVFLYTGCEKEVSIDIPDQQPKLVLNSYFTNDKIKVSAGSYAFNGAAVRKLLGATFVNGGAYTLGVSGTKDGAFVSATTSIKIIK